MEKDGGSPMTFHATSRSFYASTEPIVLSLGLQRPKNNVREWERSFHFRREYARAMKENECKWKQDRC